MGGDCKRELCPMCCDFSTQEESSAERTCCPCMKTCIVIPEPDLLISLMPAEVKLVKCICECTIDVVVVVGPEIPLELEFEFEQMRCWDAAFDQVVTLFKSCAIGLPVIYSPIVPITDYHDVRVYHDAAALAFNRVIEAEFVNPLLYIPNCPRFCKGGLVTVFGAMTALYVPLQVREEYPDATMKHIEKLWLLVDEGCSIELCDELSTMEPGRFVYRDLAMADPERLTPTYIEDYIYELFKDGRILIEIICEPLVLKKEFPLFDAVNRAGYHHHKYIGRIVLLEFIPDCLPEKTVLLVGKGTSFDTGGNTIKIDGPAGASRDKSGAAVVIGFMKIVQLVDPEKIHVIAALPLVRNMVGEEAYVADEIVKDRAQLRVRFNNTDNEGRLIMSDPLTFLKEQVMMRNLMDPHLFTIGTMTRHARLVVGNGYPIIIDNSVARKILHDRKMQAIGSVYGEPFEISWLRHDDFDTNKGKVLGEDLVQSECPTHSITCRQHQIPAAFLLQSTLLTDHDEGSCFPLKYSHIDMQGNAYNHPFIPASQPLFALTKVHLHI